MKLPNIKTTTLSKMSLPARGAWVEIYAAEGIYTHDDGRSPHGERGLK